jgi:hypothetical protein
MGISGGSNRVKIIAIATIDQGSDLLQWPGGNTQPLGRFVRPQRTFCSKASGNLAPTIDLERPSVAIVSLGADDAVITNEILRVVRPAIFGQVTWGREDNAARICKKLGVESRIRQRADPNGEIVTSINQIDIAIGQFDFDFDFGVRRQNFGSAGARTPARRPTGPPPLSAAAGTRFSSARERQGAATFVGSLHVEVPTKLGLGPAGGVPRGTQRRWREMRSGQ